MIEAVVGLAIGFLLARISKKAEKREPTDMATDEERGYYPDSWNI